MKCEVPSRSMTPGSWAGLTPASHATRLHFPGSPKPLGAGGYPTTLSSRNRTLIHFTKAARAYIKVLSSSCSGRLR